MSVCTSRLGCVVWLSLAGSLFLTGCGETADPTPTGTVTGKVTYGQQPVTSGIVSFYDAAAGIQESAELDASGTYRIERLPAGNYVVTIFPVPPTGTMDAEGNPPVAPDPENIPKKYRGGTTSPLRGEVKVGENTHNFELKEG